MSKEKPRQEENEKHFHINKKKKREREKYAPKKTELIEGTLEGAGAAIHARAEQGRGQACLSL